LSPNLHNTFAAKSFGILLFDGVEELDFVGPWEIAAMWRAYAGGPQRLTTVSVGGGRIECAKGLVVEAADSFESLPAPDFLLVPGGYAAMDLAQSSPETIAYVKHAAESADAILSVCTGSFVLHAADLLEGRRAATHWKAREDLSRLPGVTCANERWVRDGQVFSSAGVSAGIDMMLGFLSFVAGEDIASLVQLNAEYFPDGRAYGNAFSDVASPPGYFDKLKGPAQ
jgi:transcriptional regulator GlxA family with amidase domain